MKRVLLVGEASNLPSGVAFRGRSGAFLASLAGLTVDELHERFEAVNLLPAWPGRSGGIKGHLFPAVEAREAAEAIDVGGRTAVLAGKRVAKAFGLTDPSWLTPVELGRNEAAAFVIPHPSGIVRWYNEAVNRRSVGELLRRLAAKCGCAET